MFVERLRWYLDKYRITIAEFAFRCGISKQTLHNYFSGKRTASQRIAEIIEFQTDGLVSVFDIRGKDDRIQNAS
jgi:transcriptional regulator with XRE-family HTH domain